MAGGIQPGISATSIESHTSETLHNHWVNQVIGEMGSDWKIEKSMKISEIANHPVEYSYDSKGESQKWQSDGGFIFYKNKMIGVCENKYQKSRENACERVFRYLSFFKGSQMFVSCSGDGFRKASKGGATGPTLDMLKHCGAYVIENVNDEISFKKHLKVWLESLENE